jgi:hypothetical protein
VELVQLVGLHLAVGVPGGEVSVVVEGLDGRVDILHHHVDHGLISWHNLNFIGVL